MKITYIIAFKAIDGSDLVSFTSWSDAVNFIIDIQDHVLNMAITIEEKGILK